MILSIDNAGKRWKAIQRNLLAWISGIPLPLEDVWNSGWEGCISRRLYFSWGTCLRDWNWNVNKPNRFCYHVQKGHGFRESCVCNSFHISYLYVCWSVVTRGCVFSAVLFNLCQKNNKFKCRTYRYKSLKSWKIDNIDLTQQFSLSIFIEADFRYQSIKITWLLSIFIDTDFYRLTTPGFQNTESAWLFDLRQWWG